MLVTKWTTLFLTLVSCRRLFAAQCPTIDEIKHLSFNSEWQAFDSESGEKLSKSRLQDVIKAADKFALAEWRDTKDHTGVIHCYYRDKHGSNLEAYLKNSHFKPNNLNQSWYSVTGYKHCAAGNKQCSFDVSREAIIVKKTRKHHSIHHK